jgi:bifunctional DNA-binding transcriptional regulator/antitoxin component of YhaV-PrlF toxin-antitoxin module
MRFTFTARIIADNKVTVPVEIRDRGGLKMGDLLDVTVEKIEPENNKKRG